MSELICLTSLTCLPEERELKRKRPNCLILSVADGVLLLIRLILMNSLWWLRITCSSEYSAGWISLFRMDCTHCNSFNTRCTLYFMLAAESRLRNESDDHDISTVTLMLVSAGVTMMPYALCT